jgi:hypothetical protein
VEVSQLDDAGNEVIQVDQSLPVGKAQGQGTQDLLADGVAQCTEGFTQLVDVEGPRAILVVLRKGILPLPDVHPQLHEFLKAQLAGTVHIAGGHQGLAGIHRESIGSFQLCSGAKIDRKFNMDLGPDSEDGKLSEKTGVNTEQCTIDFHSHSD